MQTAGGGVHLKAEHPFRGGEQVRADELDLMAIRPLAFVAMPFGKKPDDTRTSTIDFDAIYEQAITPALQESNVDFIRADQERTGGIIALSMFERLLLADIAIVDVTIDNANVFYELGVRHAARPRSTIIISGKNGALPFDIEMIRAIQYKLVNGTLDAESTAGLRGALTARVKDTLANPDPADSPLFQMIAGFPGITLPPGYVSTFRDLGDDLKALRESLAEARLLRHGEDHAAAANAISAVEQGIVPITDTNIELAVEVLLAYREVGADDELIALVERIPDELRGKNDVIVQQYASALNRRNTGSDRQHASDELETLIQTKGLSSETAGLLGSIYKNRADEAREQNSPLQALGYLGQAIDWYRKGFLADPRDFYPGVNLCALLAIEGSPKSQEELKGTLPAVVFAVGRLGGIASEDYWTVATVFELAVLGNDWSTATQATIRMVALADTDATMLPATLRDLQRLVSLKPPGIDLEHLTAIRDQLAGLISA